MKLKKKSPLKKETPTKTPPPSETSEKKTRRMSLSAEISKLVTKVTEAADNSGVSMPLSARFKNFKEGTHTFTAQQSLRLSKTNDLDILTDLPPDTHLPQWIKVNVAEFYNAIISLCDLLRTYCTPITCPQMTAGEDCSFLWAEGEYRNSPVALPACEYIRRLMEWADNILQNERLFPSDDKSPAEFMNTCDVLCRRLLRAPMHFYHHHYSFLKEKGENERLDRLTLRYCVFALKFNLFKSKDRVLPILAILQEKLPGKFKLLLNELPMQVTSK